MDEIAFTCCETEPIGSAGPKLGKGPERAKQTSGEAINLHVYCSQYWLATAQYGTQAFHNVRTPGLCWGHCSDTVPMSMSPVQYSSALPIRPSLPVCPACLETNDLVEAGRAMGLGSIDCVTNSI